MTEGERKEKSGHAFIPCAQDVVDTQVKAIALATPNLFLNKEALPGKTKARQKRAKRQRIAAVASAVN